MKQVNKNILLVGATIVGTLGAVALIEKLRTRPYDPELDDCLDDDEDFDEPFFDDDLDNDNEEVHVVKRFRVTDEDTIRFLDEIYGDMEEEDEISNRGKTKRR